MDAVTASFMLAVVLRNRNLPGFHRIFDHFLEKMLRKNKNFYYKQSLHFRFRDDLSNEAKRCKSCFNLPAFDDGACCDRDDRNLAPLAEANAQALQSVRRGIDQALKSVIPTK